MKRIVAFWLFALLTSVAVASDETLRRGIFGCYSRLEGMEETIVDLRADGSYVVTLQGCLMSEEEGRGRWSIKDGVLLLVRGDEQKTNHKHPGRFEVVVVDADIALRPLDESSESVDGDSEIRLFRHQKANQTPEPTAMLVTPRADARVAPSTAVAHL